MTGTGYVHERPTLALPCEAHDGELKTIQLTPAGLIESLKGTFVVSEESGELIVASFNKHRTDMVVDFEHQSAGGEFSSPDGTSPAAGWISAIWHERGRGIFASVRWTERARTLIRAKEYKYLSPVVIVRRDDRTVVGIASVALTNTPAIGGMEAVAASTRHLEELELMNGDTSPNNPAQTERLIGELRALLIDKGTDAEAVGSDRNTILRAAIDAIKGGPKKEDAEKAADDAEVAASLRARLGLDANAGKAETLLALTLVDSRGKQSQATAAELATLKASDRERRADELIEQHCKSNRLNRADKDQIAAARTMALEAPERFEQIMGSVAPLVPSGRTEAPAGMGGNSERATIIRASAREFAANEGLARLTNKVDFVGSALREAGLERLSEVETTAL